MLSITTSNFKGGTSAAPGRADMSPPCHLVTDLAALADRFRPAGLWLTAVGPDGGMTPVDPDAPAFFQRYVLPALRPVAGRAPAAVAAAAGLPTVPGVALATLALPYTQVPGTTVLLAARAEDFILTPEVAGVCGRLGLDTAWLAAAAAELPAYGPAALARQADLVAAALADRARIGGLEQERDALSQQLADTYEELSLIYQLSGGMQVNRSAGDFFTQACQDVGQVMDVRGMGVALFVELQDCPAPCVFGRVALTTEEVRRLSGELLIALRGRPGPLVVDRLAGDRTFGWLAAHARQLLAVPLMRQDAVLGVLFALDKEEGEFDSVDAKLLTSIANESAVYLENATLYDDVHGLMMGLLHALTSAVDAKDAYTCGHSERVALLSRHLAQLAGLPAPEVERVYMAGLLHDVGKIGVPEAVLQKPGRLTPEEFDHMKRHPEVGARILADVKQLQAVIPGVLHHHERYDGKGYPHGLAGDRIPLMGRIICLADCFDAMTSNRTYRKALPVEVALTEIRRCGGTQFDPALAEAFLRSTPDGLRELLRNHKDRSKQLIAMQETLRAKAA
ncbi:MAG: domain/GAF domain/HD domain protein [Phycisphaerales bacterium]|nr:domain/GAF domain/HD domain protein [Phycisphaerales bacterium]